MLAESLTDAPALSWGSTGSRTSLGPEPNPLLQALNDSLCRQLMTELDDDNDDDDDGWGRPTVCRGFGTTGRWGSRRYAIDPASQLLVGTFPISTYSQAMVHRDDALDFLFSNHWSFCPSHEWKYFPNAWHWGAMYSSCPEPEIFIRDDLAQALLNCRLVCRHFRSAMMHMFTDWIWRWGGKPHSTRVGCGNPSRSGWG